MAENKVIFGLKNAHYAVITETDGVITYAEPVPMPGSVELSLEGRGELAEFYADDILYYSAASNQGYDGTLTIAKIPESFAIDVLGEVKDEVDGVITEKSDAKQKMFALMFEFDGDQQAVRHVLYYCSASRPAIAGSTKTATVEPTTSELTFVASPRPTDKFVKSKTTAEADPAVYGAWYDNVYAKVAGA